MAEDASSEVIEIDLVEWKKLKVADLRKKIGELGLESKGSKVELIARLEKYLNEQAEAELLEEVDDDQGVELEEEPVLEEDEVTEDNDEESEGIKKQPPIATVSNGSSVSATAEETMKTNTTASNKISGPGGGGIPVVVSGDAAGSVSDKLKARQSRFGPSDSDMVKKQARAERFGLAVSDYQGLGKRPGGAPTTEEVGRMKKRAERFGTTTGATILNQLADGEKKSKRLERFGLPAEELTIKNRKERFGTS